MYPIFCYVLLNELPAYREPYLFVTYFNSLDVIEIQGHAALGYDYYLYYNLVIQWTLMSSFKDVT